MSHPPQNRLMRFLDLIFEFELVVAMLALVFMMLVVVADVSMRYLFNAPIRGSYDLVEMSLVIMVFFGLARVISGQSEILIDLIDAIVPPVVVRGLALLAGIGTTGVLIFLFWSMIGPAQSAFRYGDRSLELNVPVWTIWVLALIGLSGTIVSALVTLFQPPKSTPSPVEGEGDMFE